MGIDYRELIRPWEKIGKAELVQDPRSGKETQWVWLGALGKQEDDGLGRRPLYLVKWDDFSGDLRGELAKRHEKVVPQCLGDLANELGVASDALVTKALRFGGYLSGPRRNTISPWSDIATEICWPMLDYWLLLQGIRWDSHRRSMSAELRFRLERYWLWDSKPVVDPMVERVWKCNEEFWPLDPSPEVRGWEKVSLDDIDTLESRYGVDAVNRYLDWWRECAKKAGRDYLTDVELAMFEQANSEHCRHHVFKAHWKEQIAVEAGNQSLFDAIRATSRDASRAPFEDLVSCYSDNAAVFEGHGCTRFQPGEDRVWNPTEAVCIHLVAKAETHNHPTGISPWPGAATGVGGELRDEAAVGRGGASKAGVAAYMVSDLGLNAQRQPEKWTALSPKGALFAGPRQIMCAAPLGAARYGNEFGRPQLAGAFRTLELRRQGRLYGYDKPLMLAGGLGNTEETSARKTPDEEPGKVREGDYVVVMGGRAMRIGLGGGSSSSKVGDGEDAFASVQRANPEMQRRCQQVIDACRHMADNPILLIHDVGAGGLSNAIPELLHDAGMSAGYINFTAIPVSEFDMTPEEVWCNESQERYVLVVKERRWSTFKNICHRERCLYAGVGSLAKGQQLRSHHPPAPTFEKNYWEKPKDGDERAINLPLSFLFDAPDPPPRLLPPSPSRKAAKAAPDIDRLLRLSATEASTKGDALSDLALRVMAHPAVASKAFLIHIADRNVGGMTVRDQLVGPLQFPVADCAATMADHFSDNGEAMALGERPVLSLYDPAASARMAFGEAVTNLAAAPLAAVSDIRLSANWMAACRSSDDEEADPWGGDRALHDGVHALSQACQELGVAVPVGKDSLFMASSAWQKHGNWIPERVGEPGTVRSPMSLVVTAFAPVRGVAATSAPLLREDVESVLVRLRLNDRERLAGSIWEQLVRGWDSTSAGALSLAPPDLDDPQALNAFVEILEWLRERKALLAYHDVSDGGLLACLAEMALTSRMALEIDAPDGVNDQPALASWLLHEELGAVLQVPKKALVGLREQARERGLVLEELGWCRPVQDLSRGFSLQVAYSDAEKRPWMLQLWPTAKEAGTEQDGSVLRAWTLVSDSIRLSRGDEEQHIQDEYMHLALAKSSLTPKLSKALNSIQEVSSRRARRQRPPRVAILRTQGSNGHAEMAVAFYRAGLEPVDVHMQDLTWSEALQLENFDTLALVGGFSYGDVLGTGVGWAMDIHSSSYFKRDREEDWIVDAADTPEDPLPEPRPLLGLFKKFFEDETKLVLGICNGCQVLSHLRPPGAEQWPEFRPNASRQHEARLVQVKIGAAQAQDSPWLRGMGGAVLPVAVSHGEGRAHFASGPLDEGQIPMRYCAADHGLPPDDVPYPANPNGSQGAVAAVTAGGGRILAMMPHPERSLRNLQFSWHPPDWNPLAPSPWQQMFNNAADWLANRKG